MNCKIISSRDQLFKNATIINSFEEIGFLGIKNSLFYDSKSGNVLYLENFNASLPSRIFTFSLRIENQMVAIELVGDKIPPKNQWANLNKKIQAILANSDIKFSFCPLPE
jgi:hypothetical protein